MLPNIENSKKTPWSFFEPNPSFYALLETGEEKDLQLAVRRIGLHLELPQIPLANYEWGLKMKHGTAGRIKLQTDEASIIQIPLLYAGRPQAIGGILAHELTHQFLASMDIVAADKTETEPLTDLAAFPLGLGKLVMNGTITVFEPQKGDCRVLGYLSPELCVYAYNQVNQYFSVPDNAIREYLTQDALFRLEVWSR